MPADKPKIFISHSWKDKEVALRLERDLKAAGVQVWVDHSEARAGDLITKRVNAALTWCDTLILLWSRSAEKSIWVEHEWGVAFANHKKIIPCLLDNTTPPILLSNNVRLDFRDYERGASELHKAFGIEPPVLKQPPKPAPQPERKTSQPLKRPAPPQPKQKTKSQPRLTPKNMLTIALTALVVVAVYFGVQNWMRSSPDTSLSEKSVQDMLKKRGFYDVNKNPKGEGFANVFEKQANGQIVFDAATGLYWQQGGSSKHMNYTEAKDYIAKLNRNKFAGYDDWRLPTLEEAMSLMEPEKKNGDLYIDPAFDKTQRWIWTGDKHNASSGAWSVDFDLGGCYWNFLDFDDYVRAVRF